MTTTHSDAWFSLPRESPLGRRKGRVRRGRQVPDRGRRRGAASVDGHGAVVAPGRASRPPASDAGRLPADYLAQLLHLEVTARRVRRIQRRNPGPASRR